jgi:hypothetical protein
MPEAPPTPRPSMRPAWRAAAVAYRIARGQGQSEHASHLAAVAAVLEVHPEFTQKQASAEAASAVCYAAAWHTDWFWAPLRRYLDAHRDTRRSGGG